MHPFAMLLGIVMGSAVSISLGLAMTLVVFLFLPEFYTRTAEEYPPLLRALLGAVIVAGSAAAAFYGEIRSRYWARSAQCVLGLLLVVLAWWLWPVPRV